MTADRLAPLALSMGDPAGIGLDLCLAAWLNRDAWKTPAFMLVGDPSALSVRARLLGLDVTLRESEPARAMALFSDALPVLPVYCASAVTAGTPDSVNAGAIIEAIATSVRLTLSGDASAIVTCPIAKSVLYDAGFGFPGHTEFLADLGGTAVGQSLLPVMMLAGPKLRAVPVTIHIPLKDVPAQLTSDLIYQTCVITLADMKRRFGMTAPRLAVAGLNPHAGEGGALGLEDDAVIAPVVVRLKAEGADVVGPLPADTMFHDRARETYDVAICMYHDQALIPAKALGFDDSVNVTLGLPFIRTSPDHGTAFSLAGRGLARADSLLAALRMAQDLASHTAKGSS